MDFTDTPISKRSLATIDLRMHRAIGENRFREAAQLSREYTYVLEGLLYRQELEQTAIRQAAQAR